LFIKLLLRLEHSEGSGLGCKLLSCLWWWERLRLLDALPPGTIAGGGVEEEGGNTLLAAVVGVPEDWEEWNTAPKLKDEEAAH